jgi:hypothetical protein
MAILRCDGELWARILALGAICLLGAAGQAPGLAVAADANLPNLRFEATTYDFGFAGLGQTITHRFRFTNEGHSPLVISAIKSSCSCQVGGLTPWKILPGASGAILATCNTGRRPGVCTEVIRISSNDPNQPEARLRITGTVKADFVLDPQCISFGSVSALTAPLKTVRLIDLGDGSLDLQRVEALGPYLVTNVTRIAEGSQRGFLIELTLNPDAPEGRFTVPLTLHTNLARQPHIDVPVTGNVLAAAKSPGPSTSSQSALQPVSAGRRRSVYITRTPYEEDTYVSAWLIKRFIDPNAEFSFVPADGPMPQGTGILFDLPSPQARWSRSGRACTSEQILAELKEVDVRVRAIVASVRQLEIAPWLVSADSNAGRLRSRMQAVGAAGTASEARIEKAFAILDEIHKESPLLDSHGPGKDNEH